MREAIGGFSESEGRVRDLHIMFGKPNTSVSVGRKDMADM